MSIENTEGVFKPALFSLMKSGLFFSLFPFIAMICLGDAKSGERKSLKFYAFMLSLTFWVFALTNKQTNWTGCSAEAMWII